MRLALKSVSKFFPGLHLHEVGRTVLGEPRPLHRLGALSLSKRLGGDASAYLILFVFGAASLFAGDPPFAGAVRFEQRIGQPLPLALEFHDANGVRHMLRDYFQGRPVVLYFGYARCPQLCPLVADGTIAALRQIKSEVGRDLVVISISVDPTETAAEAKAREREAIHRYGRPGATPGWNFLTGTEASIREVTAAAGFHFVYDPASRQYAHPSGFLVITPAGVISQYFAGVDFPAADVARAIAGAARGKTGTTVFDLLLLCFRGDRVSGRYGAVIWRILGVSVTLTVLTLAGGIGWMLRGERRALHAGERTRR